MDSLFDSNEKVKGTSPFVSGKVLVSSAGLHQVVNLKGINSDAGKNVYDIDRNIIFGKYTLEDESGTPRVLIGLRLADRLQTITGDTIILISPAGIERAITQYSMPSMQKCIISGIYSSNNNEYDAQYIFCSLEESQKLFNYKKPYSGN